MRYFTFLLLNILLALVGCESELDPGRTESADGAGLLSVSVMADAYHTKAVNLSNTLSNGSSIGLFLKNVDEGEIFQYDLRNAKFTAEAADDGQVWMPERAIYLNNELCAVHAYYPYNEGVTDVTAIPVTTEGQTDYLYAGNSIQVNTENNRAELEMVHALAVITLVVKRGTYVGTGAITKVGLAGGGFTNSALLNAKTGELHDFASANVMVSQDVELTLDESGQAVHTLVIPNGETANVKISLWVDGNEYYVIAPSTLLEQGARNEYTLTVDEDELGLSNVHVGDWGYNGLGNPVLWVGNHSVTIDGDINEIAFFNKSNEEGLIIKAVHCDGYFVNEVSLTGSAVLSQSFTDLTRIVRITNIDTDITVHFNGFDINPVAIANDWSALPDGVYLVRFDLRPAAYIDSYRRNDLAIGVGLVNESTGQKLLIEKYEDQNNEESMALYTSIAQGMGSSSTNTFTYGGRGTKSGAFSSVQVGAGKTNNFGNLDLDDSDLNIDPATWITGTGALSDFDGPVNSDCLKSITENGNSASENVPIARLMNAFNAPECAASVNQGLTSWYIPSCGQLGLVWLNAAEINRALIAIGGTPFEKAYYWTSSEYGADYGWYVHLGDGNVSSPDKGLAFRLRLVKNL